MVTERSKPCAMTNRSRNRCAGLRMKRAAVFVAASLAAACGPKSRTSESPATKDSDSTVLSIIAVDSEGREVTGATVEIDGQVVGTTPVHGRASTGIHALVVHQGESRGEVPLEVAGAVMRFTIQLRAPPEDREPAGKGMDPSVIEARIKQDLERVTRCYEAGLGRIPQLQGILVVSFRIERDGTVGYAYTKVARGLLDREFFSCVEGIFTEMTFPVAPETGIVRVNYPMMFTPRGSE